MNENHAVLELWLKAEGEVAPPPTLTRVRLLRSVELPDLTIGVVGDTVSLPANIANELVQAGAAELAEPRGDAA